MRMLVKYLILPSSVMTMVALACVALAWFRRTRSWAMGFGAVALSIFLVFGAGPVSFLLLGALEFQVPPAGPEERRQANTIVVLAGYGEADPDHPLSSQVNSTSAVRLLEALLLFQTRPDATVFVSGTGEVATLMREVLIRAGVPLEQVIVDSISSSTYESAQNLASHLGHAPFLLVTSAGHMPRAMGVFTKAGMHPLPAPTDFLTKKNPLAAQYTPTPLHLYHSDLAVSEYVALLWYRLKGWA